MLNCERDQPKEWENQQHARTTIQNTPPWYEAIGKNGIKIEKRVEKTFWHALKRFLLPFS